MHNHFQWMTDRDVAERYSISRISVWRWAREGIIPTPYKLGPNVTRWKSSELDERDEAQCAAQAG